VTVREAPLTERDVELYIAHLPSIEGLKGNPSGLSELLVATGWSESRLAYVASRVGLALLGSLDPEALKALDPPPFAMPTTEEAELVLSREQAIAKAFAQITRAARAREAPQQTAVRGRRRGT
jgi:hypothetical protein